MLFRTLMQRPVAVPFALIALAATADAADLSITDARIAGGKLVISGTTTAPNMRVRLDGQTGGGFNGTSEPPRVDRRLQLLRVWSYEQTDKQQVFA